MCISPSHSIDQEGRNRKIFDRELKMATSFGIYSIIFSLIIAFMLIFPSFALDFWERDSRNVDTSSHDVIEVTIDLAYSLASDIYKELRSFDDNNNSEYDRYNVCLKNYREAARDIEQVKQLYNDAHDYTSVMAKIKEAKEDIRSCKNKFASESESHNLKKKTKEFELLCEIIKLASKDLSKGDS